MGADGLAPGPAGGSALAGDAARLFLQRYGSEPEGVWYAPGRVNLIGEHTDYNDGFALPFAIDTGVCVAAGRRDGGLLEVCSRQAGGERPVTAPLAGLAPGSVRGWAAYPAGMAWALRSAGHDITGLRLAVDADLAVGAGLSSSAALECSAGLAMAGLSGLAVPRTELALLGRRAENEFVGAPTGMMDQMAVLLGALGHALLLDCRTGSGTLVPLPVSAAGLELLVIDTRVQHELSDGGYGARRRACEEAAASLGVPALRDITGTAGLAHLADPVMRRRARHVVTENERVLRAADLLREMRLASIGPLLVASHASLRDDFEVSWPEADAAVEAALRAGALGARMTGGGFGGSVIALAPAGSAGAVTEEVSAVFGRAGWHPPSIRPAWPSEGARRLR